MVVKSINPNALASATGVTFQQQSQTTAANARPEKLLFIGNAQDGKKYEKNTIYLGSGNADDVGTMFGFGSPLHRMALKAYPVSGNGSQVDTYFLPVAAPESGVKHKLTLTVSGKAKVNSTMYLQFKEQVFEAAADVASKVATQAQLHEEQGPKGLVLNAFQKELIPFTLQKNQNGADVLQSINDALEDYVEIPFTSLMKTGTAQAAQLTGSASVDCTTLTESDYTVGLSIDGGETQTLEIGSISASTAADVISAVNAKITGAQLGATTTGAVTTTYNLKSLTTGSTSKLEITAPLSGTDLFAALNISGSAIGTDSESIVLEAKAAGESTKFEIDFVDSEYKPVDTEKYGISFDVDVTSEGTGLVKIDDVLENITLELGITRVCSQFSDDLALDAMLSYFTSFRNAIYAQYVLCYTARQFTENSAVEGTVDKQVLIDIGTARREDSVNVMIAGDYGELRPLKWEERDQLLKAGISNLEPQSDGSYVIGDLVTFYHPVGKKNPLFRYDRTVCILGNMAYDLMMTFKYSDEWKAAVIIGDTDVSTKPTVRKVKDVVAAVNTRISKWGEAAWCADVKNTQKETVVVIDENNPGRFNINTKPYITEVGRIYDFVNLCGFYYGSSN